MALVLAIVSDRAQAETLRRLPHAFAQHEVIFVTSTIEALAAIDRHVPDLILVDPLMPPGDEAALVTRLRQISAAADIQMLTIPLLASASGEATAPTRRWSDWFKKRAAPVPHVCDPLAFDAQIRSYLRDAGGTSYGPATDAPIRARAGVPCKPESGAPCQSQSGTQSSRVRLAAKNFARARVTAARRTRQQMRARAVQLAQVTASARACSRVTLMALIAHGRRAANRAQIVTRKTAHAASTSLAFATTCLTFATTCLTFVTTCLTFARIQLSALVEQTNARRVGRSVRSARRRPARSRSAWRLRPLAVALILPILGITLAFGVAATSSWRIVPQEEALPREPVVEHVERSGKPKPTGTLQLTSTPQGAPVVVDGRKRGMTPLTIDDLAVGRHEVTFESNGGSVRRTVSVQAGRAATLEVSLYPGWLAVFSPIELEISEHGRMLRLDDDSRAILPAGPHELQMVNRALDYFDTKLVEVKPLEVTALSIDLPKSLVTITATPSAEVWIDGARAGETPILDLPVGIGTREILLKSPTLGERRRTVTVTTSKLLIDINLTEPES